MQRQQQHRAQGETEEGEPVWEAKATTWTLGHRFTTTSPKRVSSPC